jgi:hypothetical protein
MGMIHFGLEKKFKTFFCLSKVPATFQELGFYLNSLIWHWNKNNEKIEHEYAIAGWALCIMEDV